VAYIQDFSLLIESETNRDTIVDYFRCIRPLGDYQHQNFIDNNWKISETDILKNFIISFWLDHATTNPKEEWLAYRNLVHQVNKEFGNSAQKGYDTDRGMVYLRYGPPNQTVIRENEPSSYPYIIWQYYTHPKQSNAMYVFYDPSLTYRDYVLLHCNVRGEKNNPRWKVILQSRNTPNNDTDQEQTGGSWGGRIDDYYENPR
jgi:GWxTD domain-containing protein